MKTVVYDRSAAAALRRYRTDAERIRRIVSEYAAGTGAHANAVTQLVGRPEKRLRVGNWRVIFAETDTEIQVKAVAPQGTSDRRGWWADPYDDQPLGSNLWQLERAKKTCEFGKVVPFKPRRGVR